MFLKKPKESTDARVRSLLQKAVRRGFPDVAEAAARYVYDKGDKSWLRSRAIVVTFEEAWPLAADLALDRELRSRILAVRRAAVATKHKDAAGLGALAWAKHEGDMTVLDVVPSAWSVRVVAEGLERPEDFLGWAESQCSSRQQANVVAAARKYLAAATWGWDKACILAGAFLASQAELPAIENRPPSEGRFPTWVALDKHTPQGKDAIRDACKTVGATYRQAIWCGFYFESATVNELGPSPWFEAERSWRLQRVGLDDQAAEVLWGTIRPVLQERLADATADLERDMAPYLRRGPTPPGALFPATSRS